MTTVEQLPTMIVVYGGGFAAISLLLGLMFLSAYRKREGLVPSRINQFQILNMAGDSFVEMGVAIVSMFVAVIHWPRHRNRAGLYYPILLFPPLSIYHARQGAKRPRPDVSAAGQAHRA
jgi:hypothetical protein